MLGLTRPPVEGGAQVPVRSMQQTNHNLDINPEAAIGLQGAKREE
jgi:hypothetical protein